MDWISYLQVTQHVVNESVLLCLLFLLTANAQIEIHCYRPQEAAFEGVPQKLGCVAGAGLWKWIIKILVHIFFLL